MEMRLWTDQTFLGVVSISRREGAGRRWRESWPSKMDSNWGKDCCCCWFGKKWPSNRMKNDSRIFEHPQDCSSSNSERRCGKESCVHVLFHTPWHLSKVNIESLLAKSNCGKHCCCCWFGQKWPSNRIKIDSRIFNNPKTVVLRILKDDVRKKVVCMFCSTLRDTWAKWRSSHFLPSRTVVNIAAVVDLAKNDRRIATRMTAESLNTPKTVVLRILKDDVGKKVVCTFCSTLRDTWAKWRSSHLLPSHYHDGRCRQNLFQQNYYGRWDMVLPMTRNKAKEFWMGWWDIPTTEDTEIPKVPHQDHVDNFFRP